VLCVYQSSIRVVDSHDRWVITVQIHFQFLGSDFATESTSEGFPRFFNADWPTNAKWWIRSPFRVPEPSFTNGWAGIIKAAKQIRESVQTAQTFRPNLLHQKSEPMHERVKWFQRSLQDCGKTETLGQGHRLGLNVPRFVHVSRQGLDQVPEAYAVYALRISTNAIWAVQTLKLKVRQISDWEFRFSAGLRD